ncbi:MAG: hypothetical protein Q9174_006469 [Haloplaca sp. 1 TL-2023]
MTLEAGSWTDLGSTGIESVAGDDFNAIDANLQSTAEGKWVMNFGSFYGDLFQVGMTSPQPTKVAQPIAEATPIAFVPTPPQAQEGAFGYQHEQFYYLFFSVGTCCRYDVSKPAPGDEYKIQVCRSTTVSGPFVDKNGTSCLQGGGTTVLESHGWIYGPGGQGVFEDPELGPVLYYHYIDTRIGFSDANKQFGVNQLNFTSGWPCV